MLLRDLGTLHLLSKIQSVTCHTQRVKENSFPTKSETGQPSKNTQQHALILLKKYCTVKLSQSHLISAENMFIQF